MRGINHMAHQIFLALYFLSTWEISFPGLSNGLVRHVILANDVYVDLTYVTSRLEQLTGVRHFRFLFSIWFGKWQCSRWWLIDLSLGWLAFRYAGKDCCLSVIDKRRALVLANLVLVIVIEYLGLLKYFLFLDSKGKNIEFWLAFLIIAKLFRELWMYTVLPGYSF